MSDKNYTKVGRAAFWKQAVDSTDGRPMFRGTLELDDGQELKVSLWRNDNTKKGAPSLTGVIEKEEPSEY